MSKIDLSAVFSAAHSGQEFCATAHSDLLPKWSYEFSNTDGCKETIKYNVIEHKKWTCTRATGHSGEHRASNGTRLLARWYTSAADVNAL